MVFQRWESSANVKDISIKTTEIVIPGNYTKENPLITRYNFDSEGVRVVSINNESWFVAKDVCDVLGFKNPTDQLKSLDEDERSSYYLGRQGNVNVINESGLYHLIFKSRKKKAQTFRRWVTMEVIPSIRKIGGYILPEATKRQLRELQKKISILQRQNEDYKAQDEVFGNRTPYGTPSKKNGQPRVKPIRGHLRSERNSRQSNNNNRPEEPSKQLLFAFAGT